MDTETKTIFVSRLNSPPDQPMTDRLTWHPPELPAPLVLDLNHLFRDLA